jgi:hypothetical protein
MEFVTRPRRKKLNLFLCVAMVFLGAAPAVLAQSHAGTGQLLGTVFDVQGAAVPGAAVTATNNATGLKQEVQTNEAGQYRIVLLPPGDYTLSVVMKGFKTHKTDVTVTVGAALTVNATLALGEIAEVVEVTADVTVATTTTQPESLINLRSISNLPINGRRFQDFATLTPTVQIDAQRSQISFAGQRGINSNITIDGADYNQPFFGGIRGGERSNFTFTIPQSSIGEFQAVAYGYSAEFGRSSGGILNVVTKSGTNVYHGEAFYFLRHKDIAKRDAFNREAITTMHQWGGAIGGPVQKDKAHFLFAYEQQKNDNPRQVIFRTLDTITRDAYNAEAFDLYRGLEGPFLQSNDAITLLGRWDHQFNSKHRLAVRYNYWKDIAKNAVATGEQISPETSNSLDNNGTEGNNGHALVGNWMGTFSARMFNEFRMQYSREHRPRTANAELAGTGSTVGNTGTRSFLPTTQFDYRIQVSENLTWNVGSHSLRFGGDFGYMYADQFFKFNQFGIYSVSGSVVNTVLRLMTVGSAGSGDPANRFDSTAVSYRINIGNGIAAMTQKELAFYVSDSWRLHPRLTVNLGFRWEGYFNPEADTSNTTMTNLVRNTAFPIGKVDPAFIPDNFRQYMPRVGLAWDPWGDTKTVIRASAGYYYAKNPLILFAAPLNNFRAVPGDLSLQLPHSLPTGYTCVPIAAGDTCNTIYWQFRRIGIDLNAASLSNLPTVTAEQASNIATALGLAVDPFRGANPITWANNYESPRSLQWNVGVQREVARGWSVSADYAYVNTVHLQRNRDFNLPTPVIPASDLSLRPCFGIRGGTPCGTRTRPITSLGNVTIRESTARSLYRALTLGSTYRRSRYQFQTYYTLGWNYSNDDNERWASGFSYENSFNLLPEYNYAELDIRHQLLFNSVVNLPWGFNVSALAKFRSGRPFDPSAGSDLNGDYGGSDRPYQAIGVPFKRNSFRNLSDRYIDMRVGKRINLPKEGMWVEVTADFFNIFNFDNVKFSGSAFTYGRGITTSGTVDTIDTRFMRLHNSASCLTPTNPNGNKNCYDSTQTYPGSPFLMQLGVKLNF